MLADKQVELLSQQSDFLVECTTPPQLSQFCPNLLFLGSDFTDGIYFRCWQVDTSTALMAILTSMAPNLDSNCTSFYYTSIYMHNPWDCCMFLDKKISVLTCSGARQL